MTEGDSNLKCPVCRLRSGPSFYCEDGILLHRCRACRTVFVGESVAECKPQKDLWEDRYKNYQKQEVLDTDPYREPLFNHFFISEPVASLNRGRVLDFGCAQGLFLNIARTNGFEPVGVELSESAAQTARERRGLEVHVASDGLAALKFPENHFTLITMWDVLEHLDAPEETLREIRRILHPGGLLFVRVPNADYLWKKYRIWHKIFGRKKCFIPLVHRINYSGKSLQMLLQDNGFGIAVARSGYPEYYGSAIRRIIHWALFKNATWKEMFLGRPGSDSFILEMFARKNPD